MELGFFSFTLTIRLFFILLESVRFPAGMDEHRAVSIPILLQRQSHTGVNTCECVYSTFAAGLNSVWENWAKTSKVNGIRPLLPVVTLNGLFKISTGNLDKAALYLWWCLTFDKREKSTMCKLCLYGNLKTESSDPNVGVWCPFVCFLCVNSEQENKLIYIFYRKWKLYYYKKKKGLWPIKSLTQLK